MQRYNIFFSYANIFYIYKESRAYTTRARHKNNMFFLVYTHSPNTTWNDLKKNRDCHRQSLLLSLLRRAGSNHRPSGYEPDELPLLYSAIYIQDTPRVSNRSAKVIHFFTLSKFFNKKVSICTYFQCFCRLLCIKIPTFVQLTPLKD